MQSSTTLYLYTTWRGVQNSHLHPWMCAPHPPYLPCPPECHHPYLSYHLHYTGSDDGLSSCNRSKVCHTCNCYRSVQTSSNCSRVYCQHNNPFSAYTPLLSDIDQNNGPPGNNHKRELLTLPKPAQWLSHVCNLTYLYAWT